MLTRQETALDPYFPFEEAVDVWARTFAALGIDYKSATMRLDLCDREGACLPACQPAMLPTATATPLSQDASKSGM